MIEQPTVHLLEQYAPLLGGIATIIAALTAVIGGAFAYRVQKSVDFGQELRKERRRVYSDFMRTLVAAVQNDGDPHLTARLEAAQIGSTQVIRALAKYNAYCDATGRHKAQTRDPKIFRELTAEVLIAMRADVFDAEKLDLSEYADLLPFS
ncbi:MAG: hypothetical protein WA782_13740 [Sulfitobacter sp.]